MTTVRWESRTAAAGDAMIAGIRDGLAAAAQELLDATQAVVPVDTGELRDSATTQTGESGDILLAAVGYDDVAAVLQHEHMEYNHPHGGQAKYLEQPLFSTAEHLAETIAGSVRAEIGGGR